MGFTNAFGVPNLKFGVVTNVSTVATPYDGQVVYETDNDRIMCYNGTTWLPEVSAGTINAKGDLLVGTADNTVARLAVGGTNGHVLTVDSAETAGMKWAAASAGITYIAGASFTSQTAVAFANSVFSSTYDNYIVQLNVTAGSRTTFSLQVRDNSGTKSGTSYYGAWQGLGQNGTGGSATSNGSTSFAMPQIENSPYNTFAITVNTPADATKQTQFHGTAVAMVTTSGLGNINFGGTYFVNEAHTGLVFNFGAGSTGSYKVYGYANS